MGTELLLGVRVNLESFTTIKLSDVDLKTKVDSLRVKAAEKAELPKDSFELIYCGCILDDDSTLESCGLKNGSMVHVLKKSEAEKPYPTQSLSEQNILHLAATFSSVNENIPLRNALHRLSKRPEVIENIILTTPGLRDDPVAIAMLQDPDLMAHFTDAGTVKRIAELHPVLIEAAQSIAATLREEAHVALTRGPSAMNVLTTAYSYSLDNLSDDEDMDGNTTNSRLPNAPILPANLSAYRSRLSRILSRDGTHPPGAPPPNSSPSSSAAGLNSSGVITTEMFQQAIAQAFDATPGVPRSTAMPTNPPASFQPSNLQEQLGIMHEMGLEDDIANVQAIQLSNGDLGTAIELVFSGFGEHFQ